MFYFLANTGIEITATTAARATKNKTLQQSEIIYENKTPKTKLHEIIASSVSTNVKACLELDWPERNKNGATGFPTRFSRNFTLTFGT